METIFDHNITEDEIKSIFISNFTIEEAKEFISDFNKDEHMALIAKLYALRKDFKKAEEYINKIEDEEFRRDRQFMINTTYRMPPRLIA